MSKFASRNPGLKLPKDDDKEDDKSQKSEEQLAEMISKLKLRKMDLKDEDLDNIGELGSGSSGVVKKAIHTPSGLIMARKIISIPTNEEQRRLIQRELEFLRDLDAPYIVSFYGAYMNAQEINICMEYMDGGSFDNIYRKCGKISEDVLGKVTVAVLDALVYMYKSYKIIHRDIKPSNMLMNSRGHVKICDFGVSGILLKTVEVANTFVGTSFYMSPARIAGQEYSFQSDSWSLGLSLIEMAIGEFPIKIHKDEKSKKIGVFDLLQILMKEPAPLLPTTGFSTEFQEFIVKCMDKDDKTRDTPLKLLETAFITKSRTQKVDMPAWAERVLTS